MENTSGLLGVACWVGSGSARDAEEVGIEELLLLERQHFEYKEPAGCWCQDRSLTLEAEVAVSRTLVGVPGQVRQVTLNSACLCKFLSYVIIMFCIDGAGQDSWIDTVHYQKTGDTSTFTYTYDGKGWR